MLFFLSSPTLHPLVDPTGTPEIHSQHASLEPPLDQWLDLLQ